MNYCRSIVAGIFTLAIGIAEDRRAQYIIWMGIGLTYTLINHIRKAHISLPLDVHADPDKHCNYAGVLTDRAMPHGTHARVHENLRHSVLRRF